MSAAGISSYDDLERWPVKSLKVFLAARGISSDGQKKVLVARCFSAWELQLPVKASASQYAAVAAADASNALIAPDGSRSPDAATLQVHSKYKNDKI